MHGGKGERILSRSIDCSIVVPLYDEEASVAALVEAVRDALADSVSWELILVDDGSRDETAKRAAALAGEDGRVRLLRLARNYGQTTAMQAGFDHARGGVVVSMDGDLQNDPRDIPALVAKLEEGHDLVAGYRERRHDGFLTRKLPSWLANRIIAWITGVPIRDNGCSLKAYRRELLERLVLYADMHRFIPALAGATAGARITEVPVRHHPRRHGVSKYGLSRTWKVLSDLLVLTMIHSFRDRPLALFAAVALVVLAAGTWVGAVSVATAVGFWPGLRTHMVAASTSMVLLGLSLYLLLLGLLAETVLGSVRRRAARDPVPWPRGA